MYKQLSNGSGGPVENKNYLNSHIQPAPQLQATKVMNTQGVNLNQTAQISIKPVGGEAISLG